MATMASCINLIRKATLTSSGTGRLVLSAFGGSGSVKYESRRGAKKWYPDREFFKQFEGVVAFPEEARWTEPIETNGDLLRMISI